jgi:hypothetical protein
MPDGISVESLRGISIIAENDVYDLARLILNIHLAYDRRTGGKSRTTVHGLATKYEYMAFNVVSRAEINQRFREHNLPLGATIEPEEEL